MCASTPTPGSRHSQQQQQPKWQCMDQCGACCKLGEYEHDVLRDLLKSETDVVEYLEMISPDDGWCKWYDHRSRTCTQYETRPRFCRATPQTFRELYDVDESRFNDFAISCCQFHISNTYGDDSVEAYRHDDFIATINDE